MKPPDWLVLKQTGLIETADGPAMNVRISVRRWHPGWWVFVVRQVFKAIRTAEAPQANAPTVTPPVPGEPPKVPVVPEPVK